MGALIVLASASPSAVLKVDTYSVPFADPNPPAVWDVDDDGLSEVIISGQSGDIALLDGRDLKARWHVKVSQRGVLSPAMGVFGGTPGIVAASHDGTIRILELWDGSERTKIETGKPNSLPVSIASKMDGNDAIVATFEDGSVGTYVIQGGQLAHLWTAPNEYQASNRGGIQAVGRISHSAAVGDLNGDGILEVVAASANGAVQIIPFNHPESRVVITLPQRTAVVANVAIGRFGSVNNELIVACNTGLAYWLSYEPGTNGSPGRIVENGTVNVNGEAVEQIFAVPYDDGKFSYLVVGTQHQLGFYDGGTRLLSYGKPLGNTSPPFSTPVTFWIKGKLHGLVVDARGDAYLYQPEVSQSSSPIRGSEKLRGTAVVGNFGVAGQAQALYLDQPNRKLLVATLDSAVDPGTMSPYSPYGNFARNGNLGAETRSRIQDLQRRIEELATVSAREATSIAGSDRSRAVALATIAVALRPKNSAISEPAQVILRQDGNRRMVLFAAVLLVIVGPVGFYFFWKRRNLSMQRGRIRQAREMLNQGQAAEALQALAGREPAAVDESSVLLTYADIYANLENPPAEALPVLMQAVDRNPGQAKYRTALARTFAHVEPDTDEALAAYKAALVPGDASSDPKLALAAARAGMRRHIPDDQILRWLQIAITGSAADEAEDELGRHCIHRRIYSDKYLPAMEAAARRHTQSVEAWTGLVSCYTALKRLDDGARRAASHLLDLNSSSLEARRLLGHCLYQAGDLPRALEVVTGGGSESLGDADLVVLRARILSALRATDRGALEIYRQALELRSSDAGLEVAYARAIVSNSELENLSEADFVRLGRAATNCPEDRDILQGLVAAATQRGDHAMEIHALVALRKLGQDGAEVWRQIANAALAGKIRDEATEGLLREAHHALPGDAVVLQALVATLASLGRDDAESLAIIGRAVATGCADSEVAIYLVRTQLDKGFHLEALATAEMARTRLGDPAELNRLEGLASIGANRIEEGVKILESLVARDPKDEAALIALADAYSRQRVTHESARKVLQTACESEQDRPLFRLALARCDAQAGDFAQAIPNMKKACAESALADMVREEVVGLVAANPSQTQLRWFLTTLLMEQNRITEAVSQLDRVREIDPTQHKLVASNLDRILAKSPDHMGAIILKGKLQLSVGNLEGARATLMGGATKAPGNTLVAEVLADVLTQSIQNGGDPVLQVELGRVLMNLERWDGATECLQNAARDYRLEKEAGRLLGECYMRRGMLEYALQHLKNQPADQSLSNLLLELAQLFESSNDLEGTKQTLKHLLVIDPTNSAAKKRLQGFAGITNDPLLKPSSGTSQDAFAGPAAERYEIIEELGRGAMGIVFKARDLELDELVAIKLLPDNLNENDRALMRFRTEARSARRLAHPNIVRIHDMGESQGRKFISMEFIDGMDLRAYLRTLTKRLTLPEIYGIVYPVALALDYAHSNQIVHRDIKPANIMLTTKGVVKVSDFGIAKILETSSETMVGAVMGTPLYMSPEQIQGKALDHRTDIYALGIMMYELISGRPPFFEGDLAYQHIHVAPPPIPGLPPDVDQILQRALAKEMNARYSSAGEMAAAMNQCASLSQVPPHPAQ